MTSSLIDGIRSLPLVLCGVCNLNPSVLGLFAELECVCQVAEMDDQLCTFIGEAS